MTGNSDPKIGGLLLAAGGSTRLGRPKQLIEFEGKTLLRRSAEALTGSACSPIVVVLGAETDQCQAELAGLDVGIYINDKWQTGMSSSIRIGITHLLTIEPKLTAIAITLCDQPLVNSESLNLLTETFISLDSSLVASEYDDTVGVPAIFAKQYFDDLLALTGDTGARRVIQNSAGVTKVPMPSASFDVDTVGDLERINLP